MPWKEKIQSLLINAGRSNLDKLLNIGTSEYLRTYDSDSNTDMSILIYSLIDIYGAKIIEQRDVRFNILETLEKNQLERLAAELGVSTNNVSPKEIADKISRIPWSWGALKIKRFCMFLDIESIIEDYNESIGISTDLFVPENSEGQKTGNRFYELHTFQAEVRDQILNRFINNNEQKLLLQLPTGGGKTRTAVHSIIKYLIDIDKVDKNILWLSYSPLLLDQSLSSFLEIWPVLGVGRISIRKIYGDQPDIIDESKPAIYFASVQSIRNKLNDKALKALRANLSIIVFDEAHQIVAKNARGVINELLYGNHHLKLLGLTATPGRDYFNPIENEQFRDYFANIVKIKIPPVHSAFGNLDDISTDDRTAIAYLQELGVLSKLEHRLLDYGQNIQGQCNASFERDCYSKETLKKLAADPERNNLIIGNITDLISDKKKVLVFACSVEHAETLAMILKVNGVKSGLILGNNKDTRDKLIESFRYNNDLNVLINYEVLTAGFDAPELDAVIIARPTSSLVTYSQMLGRAMRGPLNGGNASNLVVNVSDPLFGEENEAYKKFEIYWRE